MMKLVYWDSAGTVNVSIEIMKKHGLLMVKTGELQGFTLTNDKIGFVSCAPGHQPLGCTKSLQICVSSLCSAGQQLRIESIAHYRNNKGPSAEIATDC